LRYGFSLLKTEGMSISIGLTIIVIQTGAVWNMQIPESLSWILNPYVLVPLLVWSVATKGLALWYSARASQKVWFVALLVINTIGILEIIYLTIFRKKSK